jgi:hypothetical protein
MKAYKQTKGSIIMIIFWILAAMVFVVLSVDCARLMVKEAKADAIARRSFVRSVLKTKKVIAKAHALCNTTAINRVTV